MDGALFTGGHAMSTLTYRTADDVLAVLTARTATALGYPTEYAAARVRDFLAALTASGAPGAVYPLTPGQDVYVARVR